MNFFKKAALYLGAAGIILTSCEKEPFEELEEPTPQEVVLEKTHILNQQDQNSIESYNDRYITFKEAKDFSKGDYIISGPCSWFKWGTLREIISANQDKKNFTTEMASLEEVVLDGEINYSKRLTTSDLPYKSALKSSQKGFDFSYSVDKVILDLDGDFSTEDDQTRITGNIDFNTAFYLKPKFNKGLEKISFGTEIEGDADLILTSNINKTFNQEIPLYEQSFTPIVVPGPFGIPIVITPKIKIGVGIEGDLEGKIESGAEFTVSALSDLTYEGGSWQKTENLDKSFYQIGPSASASSEIKVYGGPTLSLKIYELAGPFFSMNDYLRLNVDTDSDPWWVLSGGLEGKIGIDMGVFSKMIGDVEKTIFNLEEVIAQAEGGSTIGDVTDPRDGKEYETVKIGTQTWFAENLNFNHPKSNYYNEDPAYGEIYGRLYNWESAQESCPTGWRLPTEEDWEALINYVGGRFEAGGKLKATGTVQEGTGFWYEPNEGATDEFGFGALPGGKKNYHLEAGAAYYESEGRQSYFWVDDQDRIRAYFFNYDGKSYSELSGPFSMSTPYDLKENMEFSVRCIKEE